jgi:hypothetical protein
MSYPSFSVGEVLTAADMNAVGLWLVKTQTITTTAPLPTAVTVSDVFSSTYANYRIVYNGITTSGTNSLNLTLNGSTGSTYNDGGSYIAVGAAAVVVESAASRANIRVGIVEASQTLSGWFDIFGPNISGRTWVNGGSMTAGYFNWRQGVDTNSASHVSFTLTAAAGTLSGGTIRVYGYRN